MEYMTGFCGLQYCMSSYGVTQCRRIGITESFLSCHTEHNILLHGLWHVEWDEFFMNFSNSPVYDVKVIGFYKLHHCSSSGTNEFFKDQPTS